MKSIGMNFGHYMQIAWLFVGATLQIWVGGFKGFIIMVSGILLFHINGLYINKLWFKANAEDYKNE